MSFALPALAYTDPVPLGHLWPTGPIYSLYAAYIQPIYSLHPAPSTQHPAPSTSKVTADSAYRIVCACLSKDAQTSAHSPRTGAAFAPGVRKTQARKTQTHQTQLHATQTHATQTHQTQTHETSDLIRNCASWQGSTAEACRSSSTHERRQQVQPEGGDGHAPKSPAPSDQGAALRQTSKSPKPGTLVTLHHTAALHSRPAGVKGRAEADLSDLTQGLSVHDVAADLQALRTHLSAGQGQGVGLSRTSVPPSVLQPSTAFFRDLLVSDAGGRAASEWRNGLSVGLVQAVQPGASHPEIPSLPVTHASGTGSGRCGGHGEVGAGDSDVGAAPRAYLHATQPAPPSAVGAVLMGNGTSTRKHCRPASAGPCLPNSFAAAQRSTTSASRLVAKDQKSTTYATRLVLHPRPGVRAVAKEAKGATEAKRWDDQRLAIWRMEQERRFVRF